MRRLFNTVVFFILLFFLIGSQTVASSDLASGADVQHLVFDVGKMIVYAIGLLVMAVMIIDSELIDLTSRLTIQSDNLPLDTINED